MALVSKIGVYIFNILTQPVTDYGETKAYAINQMSTLIEKYDRRQMEAILADTTGI